MGEVICLEGLADTQLRNTLVGLFQLAGLVKVEMENDTEDEDDDDDDNEDGNDDKKTGNENGKKSSPSFGYVIPSFVSSNVQDKKKVNCSKQTKTETVMMEQERLVVAMKVRSNLLVTLNMC